MVPAELPANSRDQGFEPSSLMPPSITYDTNAGSPGPLVQPENEWRKPPQAVMLPDGRYGRLGLSRWRVAVDQGPLEVESDSVDDGHVMSIVLRQTRNDLSIGGRTAMSGRLKLGTLFLTGPKTSRWRATCYSRCDHLRAHLSQPIMAECYETAYGRPPSSVFSLFESRFSEDAILQNLARTLSNPEVCNHIMGPSFVDAVGLALASRLVALYHGDKRLPAAEGSGALAKWRLERVIDYMEANLLRPMYLAELSEVAGLSRMHFATQFRQATGYPPYAYILRRRILRAQELLLDPDASIVDVALHMGFSSQAHFTEAFRRAVGETPARWRRARVPAAPQ
jgi:AraC family transcriptional regulator